MRKTICYATRLILGALWYPGQSEKLATKDYVDVSNQASTSVNATGKPLVQQAFHPSLFPNRPRSQPLSNKSQLKLPIQVP